jgi:hypothetical protein
MDNPQPSHIPPQVLHPPSLPKHPPLNPPQNYSWKLANGYSMRVMAPIDENERSAKRQKLASGEKPGSFDDEAFFQERRDDSFHSVVGSLF